MTMKEKPFFVILFCGQYMTVFLTQYIFFTDEALFHLRGYINDQHSMYWGNINRRQVFQVPLHGQKIGVWCAITAKQIAYFLNTTV